MLDTHAMQREAWQELAKRHDLWFPSIERRALYDVTPERAITKVGCPLSHVPCSFLLIPLPRSAFTQIPMRARVHYVVKQMLTVPRFDVPCWYRC